MLCIMTADQHCPKRREWDVEMALRSRCCPAIPRRFFPKFFRENHGAPEARHQDSGPAALRTLRLQAAGFVDNRVRRIVELLQTPVATH